MPGRMPRESAGEKPRASSERLRFNGQPGTGQVVAGPAERVKVLVQFDDETAPPKMWVLVQVYSTRKPDLHREGVIHLPCKGLERKVQILAGAIAEELCGVYGDAHDPGEIARLAGIGLRDCSRQLGDYKKTYSFGTTKRK